MGRGGAERILYGDGLRLQRPELRPPPAPPADDWARANLELFANLVLIKDSLRAELYEQLTDEEVEHFWTTMDDPGFTEDPFVGISDSRIDSYSNNVLHTVTVRHPETNGVLYSGELVCDIETMIDDGYAERLAAFHPELLLDGAAASS